MNQSQTKICQNCQRSFVIKPEDFVFYNKVKIPPPTWCPERRLVRRMIWRNEKILYKRRCTYVGEKLLQCIPKILNLRYTITSAGGRINGINEIR